MDFKNKKIITVKERLTNRRIKKTDDLNIYTHLSENGAPKRFKLQEPATTVTGRIIRSQSKQM